MKPIAGVINPNNRYVTMFLSLLFDDLSLFFLRFQFDVKRHFSLRSVLFYRVILCQLPFVSIETQYPEDS